MKESWLIFCDYEGSWKSFFLKKGFRHIYLLSKDKFNWYIADPDSRYLNFRILPTSTEEDVVKKFTKQRDNVIHLKHQEHGNKSVLNMLRPFTCVEEIKYILGIKLFCITPYGLWKKLLNLGCKGMYKYGIEVVEKL